jgi:hypothetical protein
VRPAVELSKAKSVEEDAADLCTGAVRRAVETQSDVVANRVHGSDKAIRAPLNIANVGSRHAGIDAHRTPRPVALLRWDNADVDDPCPVDGPATVEMETGSAGRRAWELFEEAAIADQDRLGATQVNLALAVVHARVVVATVGTTLDILRDDSNVRTKTSKT